MKDSKEKAASFELIDGAIQPGEIDSEKTVFCHRGETNSFEEKIPDVYLLEGFVYDPDLNLNLQVSKGFYQLDSARSFLEKVSTKYRLAVLEITKISSTKLMSYG